MPSVYENYFLSQDVYQDESQFNQPMDGWNDGGNSPAMTMGGWKELDISSHETNPFNPLKPDFGYFGRAYINPVTHEIVIAHRGTEFDDKEEFDKCIKAIDNSPWLSAFSAALPTHFTKEAFCAAQITDVGDLGSDLNIAMHDLPEWQLKGAMAFTQSVMEKAHEQYPDFKISHTGHSLGGLLAEVVGITSNAPATGFDNPGIGEVIQGLNLPPEVLAERQQHITSLLMGQPNLINSHGEQLGNVIHVGPENDFSITAPFQSHSLDNFGQYINPKTGELTDFTVKHAAAWQDHTESHVADNHQVIEMPEMEVVGHVPTPDEVASGMYDSELPPMEIQEDTSSSFTPSFGDNIHQSHFDSDMITNEQHNTYEQHDDQNSIDLNPFADVFVGEFQETLERVHQLADALANI